MKLRAHHLLCLLGFRGLGYSEDFVQRMRVVAEEIETRLDLMIELVDDTDVVCEACPYCSEEKCLKGEDSQNKVRRKDKEILEALELKSGALIKNEALFLLLKGKRDKMRLERFCKDCEWLSLGYCKEGLADL